MGVPCVIEDHFERAPSKLTAAVFVPLPVSFNAQSLLRNVRSLFQSEFSKEREVLLPLSNSSTFSFP